MKYVSLADFFASGRTPSDKEDRQLRLDGALNPEDAAVLFGPGMLITLTPRGLLHGICGNDEHLTTDIREAVKYLYFNWAFYEMEDLSTTQLTEMLDDFCAWRMLRKGCALELLHEVPYGPEYRWLSDFIDRWEEAEEREAEAELRKRVRPLVKEEIAAAARAFNAMLYLEVGDETYRKLCENPEDNTPHDHCDANVLVLKAIEHVRGCNEDDALILALKFGDAASDRIQEQADIARDLSHLKHYQ